ncbi:MAG: type II toxin-antitoxin system RelB/DinJ family antitoxin [Candidatus Paceibacterota bacterium]
MTTINIRIDENIKNKATKTFASMGLDVSSAVKLFLHQSILEQRIPFEIRTVNGYTMAEEDEMLRQVNQVKEDIRTGKAKGYKSIKAMHRDILSKNA